MSAELAASPRAEITMVAAPFLRRYAIYWVFYYGPHHPLGFYVGYAAGLPARILSERPAEFVAMAQAEGVDLRTPADAAAYAVAYVETTRDPSELFYVVRSVDDARTLPGPDPDEAARIAAFRRAFEPRICPPAAETADVDFRVRLYAVRDQSLEEHTLLIRPDGDLSASVLTLARDLPLVRGG